MTTTRAVRLAIIHNWCCGFGTIMGRFLITRTFEFGDLSKARTKSHYCKSRSDGPAADNTAKHVLYQGDNGLVPVPGLSSIV